MAILVGIDEAGYGPVLGPLVVSSVAFQVPDNHLRADLWKLLSPAVGKTRSKLTGRLLITDSKKAYNRKTGIGHLRRSVLASLSAASRSENFYLPSNALQLLQLLCPDSTRRLSEYSWYEDLIDYQLDCDPNDIELASTVLKKTLSAKNTRLLNISSQCLDVAYYNKMVSAVKNKSTVLFTAISTLIKQAYDKTYNTNRQQNHVELQIIVDRQGGRTHYRNPLSRMFPQLDLTILKEQESISSYELKGRNRTMRLHFPVKADTRFLPVALASMTSKYVREILVDSLNRYFLNHNSKLKPTAGYWKDGHRFIKDIESKLPNLQYDPAKLIRSR